MKKLNILERTTTKILTSKEATPIKRSRSIIKRKEENVEQVEIAISKKIKKEENDMRKVYIDAYGVELDFAGFYYHSSKFIPNQDPLILTLCWHITPEGKSKVVQTT